MNNLSRLLAWRYLMGTGGRKSISTMIAICLIATFVASFSLTLVVSVMGGFEVYTHKKLQSIHPPITMESPGNILDVDRIADVIVKEFENIVDNYAPSSYEQVLIRSKKQKNCHQVSVKAVDPEREPCISSIESNIVLPQKNIPFSSVLKDNRILIGKKLASLLHVSFQDPVIIMYPDKESSSVNQINLQKEEAIVGGIFETGLEEIDQMLCYCSRSFIEQMDNDTGSTKIGISLQSNVSEEYAISALKKRFGMHVYSWRNLYPALISALKLEKYAMFFILLLISLVASMNLISLMCMYIEHKKKDIALLLSYGMPKRSIQSIFVMIGVAISSVASALGIITAVISGYYIDKHKLITLPNSYYISHLPVIFDIYLIILIFLSSIVISCCASYFASKKLLQQKPITILSK